MRDLLAMLAELASDALAIQHAIEAELREYTAGSDPMWWNGAGRSGLVHLDGADSGATNGNHSFADLQRALLSMAIDTLGTGTARWDGPAALRTAGDLLARDGAPPAARYEATPAAQPATQRAAPAGDPGASASAETATGVGGATPDAPVLVVDDDDQIRSIVAAVLADEGYPVVEAPHGAAALEVARRTRPRAILLDMRMPVMDGWEFVKAYRSSDGPHAPIIVMTAAQSARTWCAEVDGQACLAKPFDVDDLLATVERVAA